MEYETFEEIVQPNIDFIEQLTPDSPAADKYPILAEYLKPKHGTCLRDTLLCIFYFLKNKKVIRDGGINSYIFWLTTKKLTEIRGRKNGDDTSSRYINMMCAMGLFEKKPQHKSKPETLLPMVEDFLDTTEHIRAFGTFKIVKYSQTNLRHIENTCEKLKEGGITAGNISYSHLVNAGLDDIGNKVYYLNNRLAPLKKERECSKLFHIMDRLIEEKGYCTQPEMIENFVAEIGTYKEFKKVIRDCKKSLKNIYWYKPPSNAEIEKFGLEDHHWIYLRLRPVTKLCEFSWKKEGEPYE